MAHRVVRWAAIGRVVRWCTMRRGVVAIAIVIGSLLGAVAPASPESGTTVPRLGVRWGERIGFPHDGVWCWDYSRGPRGRYRVVLIEDEREYRGEACQGRRIAIVRLPRGAHRDSVRVWETRGHVWVIALRHHR